MLALAPGIIGVSSTYQSTKRRNRSAIDAKEKLQGVEMEPPTAVPIFFAFVVGIFPVAWPATR